MVAPPVTDLVDLGALRAVRAAMTHLARMSGTTVDADRALADVDAVRDMLRSLADSPALRAAVRTGAEHAVTDPDQARARVAVDSALAQIKTRTEAARKAEKAARRGTAEQRRAARLEGDLAKARQEKEAALGRAQHAEDATVTLRAQLAELDEAVQAESRRADAAAAATDAARSTLSDPAFLARHLTDALDANPDLWDTAAAPLEEVDRPTALVWFKHLLAELVNPTAARARTAARALSVQMLGGGLEVGGSCALVCADDTRLLIDAGTRPAARTVAQMPPPGLTDALADGPVQAIVLTHAHADHIGWVPAILAAHPGVLVYATSGTADLAATMWMDTVRIFARGDRLDGLTPYTEGDVRVAIAATRVVEVGRPVQVGDLSFELFPAGHVLGAAGVHVTDGTHRVVVSGDVSGPGQATVGGWVLPEPARRPDLLVLESTYGATVTASARARVVDTFVRDVELTVSGGGRVLVPAFALGRAQEIALVLAARLPWVPVLIDGLAREVTTIFENHPGGDGQPLRIWSDQVRPVPKGHTASSIATFGPGVVITTSGMLTAGPAISWAREVLPDPRSLLAVVGYQDPQSPGGRVLRLVGGGDDLDLPTADGRTEPVVVNAAVRQYGLGAHATSDELVTIATDTHAAVTMLVHGEPAARSALADRLRMRHLGVADPTEVWRADR